MKNDLAFFVDVSNLYYCTKKKFETKKVNYEKLINKVKTLGNIRRSIAYGSQIDQEAKNFISCLKRMGYDTKYRQAKKITSEEREQYRYTSWNVGISMDAVKIINKVDSIIIASSDAELVPLVEWVKDQGVRVTVLACGISKELKEACDNYIELDDDCLDDIPIVEVEETNA